MGQALELRKEAEIVSKTPFYKELRSKVYLGDLAHVRLSPVEHRFNYPACTFALDLAELDKISNSLRSFSYNSHSVFSIWDKDYIKPTKDTILNKALGAVEDKSLVPNISRVVLVTSPRYLNYVFNPVSFYYYLNESDEPLCWLAEVNNTFSEKHLYFLKPENVSNERAAAGGVFAKHPKEFHVSPFMDLKGEYLFRFSGLGDCLDIRVDLAKEGKTVFKSALTGSGSELTGQALSSLFVKFPLAASLNMPRILKEAGSLYFKKNLPVFAKPAATAKDTIQLAPSSVARFSKFVFRRILSRISVGRLLVHYPDSSSEYFGLEDSELKSELQINDNSFFSKVALGGDIAFGDAVAEGLVESPDMVGFLALAIANQEMLDGDTAFSKPRKIIETFIHYFRKNSISNSKANIGAHYDLSNEFFKLFLDPTMTYSSAVFRSNDSSLMEAQLEKLRMISSKAGIGPSSSVLEIGCGWGSLAIDTVTRTDCRWRGVTLSEEQQKLALSRIRSEGLAEKIQIDLEDYRNISGTYDQIVSIEMLEAVGREFLPNYFETISRLLKKEGKAAIQVIVIDDDRYEHYCRNSDWIQKYIFPGGHLPSVRELNRVVSGVPGLEIESVEKIGLHYARTLAEWRILFREQKSEIPKIGFDDKFCRMWEYYLDYCEAGVRAKIIDCCQIVLNRGQENGKI